MSQHFRFPIPIPNDQKVTVKLGDKIDPGQPLGQPASGKTLDIDIAAALGVKPKEISRYLLVSLGQDVKANDPLARRQRAFNQNLVLSPRFGKVHKISSENGLLTLSLVTDAKNYLTSPVKGEVTAVTADRLEIAVTGKIYSALEISGYFGWGPLAVVGQWGTAKIEDLTIDHAGTVAVIADKVSLTWLSKAAALEVAAVVCAGLKQKEDVDVKIPFVGLTVDATNQLDRHLWERLLADNGKIALIDPKEKILGVAD